VEDVRQIHIGDRIFSTVTFMAAFTILATLVGILITLFQESGLSLNKFGFIDFIFTNEWDPVRELFGAAVPLVGTLLITVLALGLAIPTSLGIAIFITEICPNKLKSTISTAIELLAAIPSIIYGMWGLFTFAPLMSEYIEPFLQETLGEIPFIGLLFHGAPLGIDLFTACIVLSIMITPFIASIARDTIELTPQILRESAYAVGATQWEVVRDVILPFSKHGIYGGVIIALGRALGETMAVAFVLGNRHEFASSLFDATTTITTTLANEFTEADSDIFLSTLFSLALILFVLNFAILAFAKYIVHRGSKKA